MVITSVGSIGRVRWLTDDRVGHDLGEENVYLLLTEFVEGANFGSEENSAVFINQIGGQDKGEVTTQHTIDNSTNR